MKTSSDAPNLNEQQRRAVEHGHGPLLIIAGAGTGKTTVITERIKWLIANSYATPEQILALTFTEKAAQEMEQRVDAALPYGYTQLWVSTFHGCADRILRQEAIHIGLDPSYHLMSEPQSVMFFKKHLFSFSLDYFRPLGNPTKFIDAILQHISRLKDEDVTPEHYALWVKEKEATFGPEEKRLYNELSAVYIQYECLKEKEGVMDFGDLIRHTLHLFRTRPAVLASYQAQFPFLLIDEFQDTNYAQNQMAMLLAGPSSNITVVGDDDQAVYRWRGAAVSNIIQFRQHFPQATMVVLTQNYRSTQRILDASYALVQHNNPDRLEIKESLNKRLVSERTIQGEAIKFFWEKTGEDEADRVVKEILSLKQARTSEIQWKDIAILVRANSHAEPFIRSLSRAGIPSQFLGPGKLFRQPEIVDLIAYLKTLVSYTDTISFFRVVSLDIFSLEGRDIQSILQSARVLGISLFEACEMLEESTHDETHPRRYSTQQVLHMPHVSAHTTETVSSLVRMIHDHMDHLKDKTAGQLLYDFLEKSGLLKRYSTYSGDDEEKKLGHISAFFDLLRTLEGQYFDASVSAVVDWITMSMNLGESPLSNGGDWTAVDAVNILTVHGSKGLEFPIVFVVNLVGQRFPTMNRKEAIPIPEGLIKEVLPEGDFHLQEERRLCYVAMTRARDLLYLTAAKQYGDGVREKKLSPFIEEALGKEIVQGTVPQASAVKQLPLLEWKPADVPVVRPPTTTALTYLSFSQIETYRTCPLQYKYRYVMKIPAPVAAAASFGTSVHAAMQRFYEAQMRDLSPIQDTKVGSKEYLLRLLDESWIPVGYETQDYEKKMKERGKAMLSGYYDTAYNPSIIPTSLEQVFKIKLTPALTIGGKIDRIDTRADGTMEIWDYKTGKRPMDKEIEKSLQMTIYAMAATDPGVYAKPVDKVVLSFYFFEAQETVSRTRSEAQMKEATTVLQQTATRIASGDFPATPSMVCRYCDYRMICDAWK